jgi:lipoprotein-anchoring transpeptidase ErfK/SrfK
MKSFKAIFPEPSNNSTTLRHASLGSSRTSRARRLLAGSLLTVLGSAVAMTGAPSAGAAAKPKAKTASKVNVVEANVCPKGVKTKVAVQKTGKWGDVIKVWEAADEAVAPKWTFGVGDESHTRLVFSVIGEQAGWLQVNLPVKPNGSVGWVKADDVTTYITPYYVLIELSKRRLTACNAGVPIARESIGVGRPGAETPKGTFYLLDLLKNPKKSIPGYGPYAFGFSGFSEVPAVSKIFDGGRIGMHGASNPGLGTGVSSGCIRMTNAAITKLAKTLFLGTPVQIV